MSNVKTEKNSEVVIHKTKTGSLDICVIGQTPLIFNRMSEKAWRELLMPAPKKNRAAKEASLKHVPMDEYRASVYRTRDKKFPTELMLPVQCFKGAAMTAALDLPGSSKTQIGRLLWIVENWVAIYGVPQLSMMIVRMKDMNRTPDVRTRAIVPEWVARFKIQFVEPILTAQSVINCIAAGGLTAGVGDFRQEKGKGNFGQFRICEPDDKDFKRIMSEGGRAAQAKALENPESYDQETDDLLSWFDVESRRRGIKVVA